MVNQRLTAFRCEKEAKGCSVKGIEDGSAACILRFQSINYSDLERKGMFSCLPWNCSQVL